MKRHFFCILILLPLISAKPLLAQEQRWQELRGVHFLVYYKNAEDDFANTMLERAEDYYYSITQKLGLHRYNFWINEKRVKIYIYDDAQSYQADAKQPEWSGGCVDIENKIIRTFSAAGGFMHKVLPHELGHIIFRELIGFNNLAVPLWLEEGVACYMERPEGRAYANRLVKQAIIDAKFISLKNLANFNPRQSRDRDRVALFYAESLAALTYLIREHGPDNFALFCEKLRDNHDLDRAIAAIYPYKDLEDFNQKWQEHLEK
jgi:hypothetical protein